MATSLEIEEVFYEAMMNTLVDHGIVPEDEQER